VQEAFDYVSDLTCHPEWSGGELKVREILPGPVAIGEEYQSYGEVLDQKNRANTLRVSQYEPPYKFGFVMHDPDIGDISREFTFAAQEGGTSITRVINLSLNPIMAFLFRFFI
jgi:hypothetical protein